MPVDRFPIRPEDDYLALLDAQGSDGKLAADTIRTAWNEIDRLRREVDDLIEYDTELRAELAVAAIDSGFDPRGHFVYVLYGDNDAIVYVGRSSNVMSRVGTHLLDPRKLRLIRRVGLVRCPDLHASMRLEGDMIRKHAPPLNTAGIEHDVKMQRRALD